jgi:hypothetical protein
MGVHAAFAVIGAVTLAAGVSVLVLVREPDEETAAASAEPVRSHAD